MNRTKGSDGDWVCSDSKCGNLNFARRTSCNRCGKEKSIIDIKKKKQGVEIGKAAAEKSHGLFSAEDWQCSKCCNVNWARRQTCNMCNAPKFGEMEERTGYGGGYNERDGVEYIAREDSDGEYDEFGRKKKKYRDISKNDEEPKRGESASNSKTQDTDEEEDDEDEGDLSKYDLWGDDDSDEECNSNTDNSVNNKKVNADKSNAKSNSRGSWSYSRSRSRSLSRSRDSSSSSRSHSPSRKQRYRSRSRERSERQKKRERRRSYSRSSSPSRSRSRSRERCSKH